MDDTLDTYNRFDVILPICLVELPGGFEYLDNATLVTPAPLFMVVVSTERRGRDCYVGGCLKQRRLVAFDLDDQAGLSFLGSLEGFFWQ
jgi:hypothetical protein